MILVVKHRRLQGFIVSLGYPTSLNRIIRMEPITSTPIFQDRAQLSLPKNNLNGPLPDVQQREIQVIIDGLQGEKRLINAEIGRIRPVMDNLYLQLKAKNDRISTLRGMVSPLKHFPNELISQVFEDYNVDLPQPPWLLGHICSRWREVALSTPNLWSSITVQLRDTFPRYSNFDKEKVLFTRSAKGLVSCTLVLSRPTPSIYYFLPLFIKHANHIRHLILDSVDAFLPLLTLAETVTLYSLEELDLNFFPQGSGMIFAITRAGEEPRYNSINLFKSTPHLRRVTIRTGGYDQWDFPNIIPLQLPWGQLTHLFLSPYLDIQYTLLSTVLQLCKNLSHCRFHIPPDDRFPTLFTPIELQNLEVLEIMHGYRPEIEHASNFLQYLLLPSLKRLILTSHDGIAALWPLNDISELILKSACNIKVFHARSFLGQDSALPLLNNMPSLTELLIQGITPLPVILGRMAHDDFLPHLKYIECRSYVVFDDTPEEIIEALGDEGFMETPSDFVPPLSVHIVTTGEEFMRPQLDSLQRNQLNVNIEKVDKLYEKECEL
ncbi:hypothetical protein BDZ94DRAFT_237462 [Collybia nuda]|uniref:F-box domain-containing protein n=1 Tax=Collybia nuda TaxID=64659 RepID=A0A9P5XTA7_9AGAR|nr:hypothetical protein BDZ94DRAFT_237462 [Collybia nuda]